MLTPPGGSFSNAVVLTLTAPPTGARNLVSFNNGATWVAAGTTLTLDGYGTGSATVMTATAEGTSQSAAASFGPYLFAVAPAGVVPVWAPDHSMVGVTLTNATTNAVVAWRNTGAVITTNTAFDAASPGTFTLYGFKPGYTASTNAWVLQRTAPPTLSPPGLALSLANLAATITVIPPVTGAVVSVRQDGVVCVPPVAQNANATLWWNVAAFDPLYWVTNRGSWVSYTAPVAAYTGPAAASTFGNGPCAIYTNLQLAATAAAPGQLVSLPAYGFYPLAPAAPVVSPNGGVFNRGVGATITFPLAEQFGYSPDSGASWVLSYYSGVAEGDPAGVTPAWFNPGAVFDAGPQGYPLQDWPHFPGAVTYSTIAGGLTIWSLTVGPGDVDASAYAAWDGSTRLDLPFIQPPDGTSQVNVLASGFNAFSQTNQPMLPNGYGSELTGGGGPWPAPNVVQTQPFQFQLPALSVASQWAPDHSTLSLEVSQSPAGANLYYTLDGTPPSTASPLLATGSVSAPITAGLILNGPGALRLASLGYDTPGQTSAVNGVTYPVADRGVRFQGFGTQAWSSTWAAAAPVLFNPPPGRYYAPTSTVLTCASPRATIWVAVTPDPGNDTNAVGVSGSPMAVNGTYYWSGSQFTNEIDDTLSLGLLGANPNVWALSWSRFGVLYTSTNLYGASWTPTNAGVAPAPVTSRSLGWHLYTKPVAITTNTVVQAYALTPTSFSSPTTNALFTFGNPNPFPVGYQYLSGTTLRFSWATNVGPVSVLFATNLAGPWTNVYTGAGVLFGTSDIRDFTLPPPSGFYRFFHP